MMYTSFDGDPGFAWQIELFVYFVHWSSWVFDSSSVEVQLDLDVLIHDFTLGIEEDNGVGFL